MRHARNFIRRHPIFSGIVVFVLVKTPEALDAWLSLWQKAKAGNVWGIDWLGYFTGFDWVEAVPLLAIPLLLYIIWQARKPQDDVSTNLPTHEDVLANLGDWVRSEIQHVHFGWLWNDDPYISFGLRFSNLSQYDIEITGIEGSANINDTPTTRAAKVPDGFRTISIPKLTRALDFGFYQPIGESHAKTIQDKLPTGIPIPFGLGSVGWTGSICYTSGKEPFPRRLPCAAPFEVDGSRITPEHSQANIQHNRLVGTGPEPIKP